MWGWLHWLIQGSFRGHFPSDGTNNIGYISSTLITYGHTHLELYCYITASLQCVYVKCESAYFCLFWYSVHFHISTFMKLHLYACPWLCRVCVCVWWTVSNGFVRLLELKKLILIGHEARTNTCIFILRLLKQMLPTSQINTHKDT